MHGGGCCRGYFPDAPKKLMIACGHPTPLLVIPYEAVEADAPLLDQFVEMIDVADVLFAPFGVDIPLYRHGCAPAPLPSTRVILPLDFGHKLVSAGPVSVSLCEGNGVA